MLDKGGAKMSKTSGNVLDPDEMASLLSVDGVRYVVLREVPFDRDADVSYDGFVRRYNADLANDFGNLLNRTLNMTSRYLNGERATPRDHELAGAWDTARSRYDAALSAFLLHDGLAALWEFVGEANRFVDREQPWSLAKQAKADDTEAADRLRGVLGDLLEACRVIGLAAAPFMPGAAERVWAQLGLEYPYAPDGSGGPPLRDLLAWGGGQSGGRIGNPEILFPRVEIPEA
jgi:methionyl-tRNA synthetase